MTKFEILAAEPTELGLLCLRRRELLTEPGTVVTEITLNHEFLMSSYHTDSERALASRALDLHDGTDLRVLIGGLGLGYTAWEVLQSSRVGPVEVVEFLPAVTRWLAEGLVPLSEPLNGESRLAVTAGDVYARLLGDPTQTHDLILIDVDHSPDETLDGKAGEFYTRAGLERARRHLEPNGILAVWSAAESSPFADALHATFDDVRVESIEFENRLIDETSTDTLFLAR